MPRRTARKCLRRGHDDAALRHPNVGSLLLYGPAGVFMPPAPELDADQYRRASIIWAHWLDAHREQFGPAYYDEILPQLPNRRYSDAYGPSV